MIWDGSSDNNHILVTADDGKSATLVSVIDEVFTGLMQAKM
jgi:hypothetical protein